MIATDCRVEIHPDLLPLVHSERLPQEARILVGFNRMTVYHDKYLNLAFADC